MTFRCSLLSWRTYGLAEPDHSWFEEQPSGALPNRPALPPRSIVNGFLAAWIDFKAQCWLLIECTLFIIVCSWQIFDIRRYAYCLTFGEALNNFACLFFKAFRPKADCSRSHIKASRSRANADKGPSIHVDWKPVSPIPLKNFMPKNITIFWITKSK